MLLSRAPVLLVLLVSLSPAARAAPTLFGQPLRLDFTESMYLNAHGDPGDGDPTKAYYGEGINRLNVDGAAGPWLLQLRLDTSDYVHSPAVGDKLTLPNCDGAGCTRTVTEPGLYTHDRARLNPPSERFQQNPFDYQNALVGPVPRVFEKMSLSYQGRAIEATLGDFYANFGRGLVLSVRKVDELGIDTTIFGGKVTARAGGFTGTVLAGETNTQNLDETNGAYLVDPDDLLAAARAEYRVADKVTVGVHGLVGQAGGEESFLQKAPDTSTRGGFTVDAPMIFPWPSLYGEYAHRADVVVDAPQAGDAYYVSATAFAGKTTWLFEGKRYVNYDVFGAWNDPNRVAVYMAPPTLERVQTQLTENTDVTAGRLRTDVDVSDRLSLYASGELGTLALPSVTGAAATHTLVDLYAGGNIRWDGGLGHLFPLVGWRRETADQDGSIYERLVAFEYDGAQPLAHGWSLESQGLVWLRTKGADWREGQVYLALKHSPDWVFVGGYEFTTDPAESRHQHDFFNVSAQWNATSATSVRLFAGGQRGGLKCVSGLCRVFPSFNGVKLELVLRG